MSELNTDQMPSTTDTAWAETVSRLLELQHKLDARDRLFNEERSELRNELSRLTAHYMQDYQGLPEQPRQQWRTDRPPRDTR